MEDFFKLLPDIIYYIIGGYIYITIYRFVSHKEKIGDIDNLIMSSLTVGFIIKNIWIAVGQTSNFVYIVSCAIAAFLFAHGISWLNSNEKALLFLQKLQINRTNNPNIWYDFFPSFSKPVILKLISKENDFYYIGCCVRVEEGVHSPYFILSHYQKFKLDGTIVDDNINNDEISIILDAELFSSIERIIINE